MPADKISHPQWRHFLVSLVVLTSALHSASSHAKQKLISVQALVGFSMLDIDGHTRLCCGENPYMTGYGGEFGVRLGIRYATYGQITLSGMLGYHSIGENPEALPETKLVQTYVELSKDLVIPFSGVASQSSTQKHQPIDLYLGPTVFIGQLGHNTVNGETHFGYGFRTGILFPAGPINVGPEFGMHSGMHGSGCNARIVLSW